MLIRIILLALGVWLIFLLLRQYRRSLNQADTPPGEAPQDMVRCAVCGTHLPKSESIEKQGVHYCCEEHSRRAGQ